MTHETNVVRLVDRAPGYSVEDVHDLCRWLRAWADHLETPGPWMPVSLVVVVESDGGRLGVISQGVGPLDNARVVGLMQTAAIQKALGEARIEDIGS